MSESVDSSSPTESSDEPSKTPEPLSRVQRRILGVLIEKARTTPDAYPLSLNGLVTGCNQKSNRSPVMSLTPEQVEDELIVMRERQIVAEVHGGGRVPKYRHYGYDYLGVKGMEAGVMTELLLRGEQTAGELRTRASRFEPIADLATLHNVLESLMSRQLVIPLTPPGRGQLFTHNLYLAEELERLKSDVGKGVERSASPETSPARSGAINSGVTERESEQLATLQQEVADLKLAVAQLSDRLSRLEA